MYILLLLLKLFNDVSESGPHIFGPVRKVPKVEWLGLLLLVSGAPKEGTCSLQRQIKGLLFLLQIHEIALAIEGERGII